MQQEAELSL